jgi:hypothetical protein
MLEEEEEEEEEEEIFYSILENYRYAPRMSSVHSHLA